MLTSDSLNETVIVIVLVLTIWTNGELLVDDEDVPVVPGELEPRLTTVGMRVELSHLVPIPVGRTVRAEATLEKCEGRRLTFTVSVMEDQTLVAVGKLTRVIVDRDQFIEKAG